MRISKPSTILAALALVAPLFAIPSPAHADTYQIFNLGGDNRAFYGISDSGLAVFDASSSSCAGGTCYYTYLDGVSEGVSSTAPVFTADDGSRCTPSLPTGWIEQYAVCNNGRATWTGTYQGNPPEQVYFNANPTPPSGGSQFGGSAIYMNGLGDSVIDDGFSDDWYYALDLTTQTTVTPEPSSLLLLATGILILAFVLRRRNQLA